MLALKYRPRKLSDVMGQTHVIRVIEKMLEKYRKGENIIPAGMIFSGIRGTGKTTTARVVAMALNCEKVDDIEPCGECDTCMAIADGVHSSVLEMDAASNGLVDDIRSLREMVLYAHDGDYRIVILDEAHNLSKEAFNALLKQLEEPPPNVLYILVTTQPEKIIDTVHSRSLRFDFRAIANKHIEQRLLDVAKAEKVELGAELVSRIAAHADGGMRDALMLLEHLIIADDVTIEGFEKVAGLLSDADCAKIILMIAKKDFIAALSAIDETSRGLGVDTLLNSLAEMLIRVLRVHLGAKVSGEEKKLAEMVTQKSALQLIKIMWDIRKMRGSRSQDKATLRMAVALLCGSKTVKKQVPVVVKSEKVSGEELSNILG